LASPTTFFCVAKKQKTFDLVLPLHGIQCGNKRNELWLIYAINRNTKRIIDFVVGRRTKENIAIIVTALLNLQPKAIYSDRLNIYESLICKTIHKIYTRCINYIERKNLTLRTFLKRLARRTICFTRSERMLYGVVFLWVSDDVR